MITIIVLLIIVTFIVFCCRKKGKKKEQFVNKPVVTYKSPPGKSFGEYIPPARRCTPEMDCFSGSYVKN